MKKEETFAIAGIARFASDLDVHAVLAVDFLRVIIAGLNLFL